MTVTAEEPRASPASIPRPVNNGSCSHFNEQAKGE